MEYFDRESYSRLYNKHSQIADNLSNIAMLWPQLGIGPFTKKTIEGLTSKTWIQIQPQIEEEVKAPVLKELDKLGINNKGIRESMLKNGCADAFSVLSEIRNHVRFLSDSELEAFVIQEETSEVVLSKQWEQKLRDRHTHKPQTENQKRFAEISERFQKDYQALIELLPSNVPVFSHEGDIIKGLFRLKGRSQYIDFFDKSVLKQIR